MMFRSLAQDAEGISATANECTLLANIYSTSPLKYQQELSSILQKL